MKKIFLAIVLSALVITAFSFKNKISTDGEGEFVVMNTASNVGVGALVISYGNEKSEIIDLKKVVGAGAVSYSEACISNGDILINQFKKLKAQGYELKSTAVVEHITTYILEKK